jgi:hypothetical protein
MGDDDRMLAYIFNWHLLDAHINSACMNGEDQPVPTEVRIVFGSPQARTTKSVKSQRPSSGISLTTELDDATGKAPDSWVVELTLR